MKRILSQTVLLTLGLAAAALAQKTVPAPLQKGTPVVVVGQISAPPPSFGFGDKSRMRVHVGTEQTPYTLHLRGAQLYDAGDQKIAKSKLHRGWWVRAEGTVLDDPRRIKVAKLHVIGKDAATFRQSAFYRPDQENGYVESVAGVREVFPAPATTPDGEPAPTAGLLPEGTPVVLVAQITNAPPAVALGQPHKMQVALGPDKVKYTLHFGDAPLRGPGDVKYTANQLKSGMWVRAEGNVMNDARRIRVNRLEVLGNDWNAYHGSPYFRTESAQGYLMKR